MPTTQPPTITYPFQPNHAHECEGDPRLDPTLLHLLRPNLRRASKLWLPSYQRTLLRTYAATPPRFVLVFANAKCAPTKPTRKRTSTRDRRRARPYSRRPTRSARVAFACTCLGVHDTSDSAHHIRVAVQNTPEARALYSALRLSTAQPCTPQRHIASVAMLPTRTECKLARAVKSAAERQCMQYVRNVTLAAFRDIMRNASTFATTGEMRAYGVAHIRRALHFPTDTPEEDFLAYPPILTVDGGGETLVAQTGIDRVHPKTFDDVPLVHAQRPLVLLDLGARYAGYCADITRTFPVHPDGQCTRAQQLVLDAVRRLHAHGCKRVHDAVHTGATLSYGDIAQEVHTRLQDELHTLAAHGGVLDDDHAALDTHYYCPHGLGHTVGLQVHDAPEAHELGALRKGMVVTIEPGIYTSQMCVRWEDTVIVGEAVGRWVGRFSLRA